MKTQKAREITKKWVLLVAVVIMCITLAVVAIVSLWRFLRPNVTLTSGPVKVTGVQKDRQVTAISLTVPQTSDNQAIQATIDTAMQRGEKAYLTTNYTDNGEKKVAFSQTVFGKEDIVSRTVGAENAQEGVSSAVDAFGLFGQFFIDQPTQNMTAEEVWANSGLGQQIDRYNYILNMTAQIDPETGAIHQTVRANLDRVATYREGDPGIITQYEKSWSAKASPGADNPLTIFQIKSVFFEASTEIEVRNFLNDVLKAWNFEDGKYLEVEEAELGNAIWQIKGVARGKEDAPSIMTVKENDSFALIDKTCETEHHFTVEVTAVYCNAISSTPLD